MLVAYPAHLRAPSILFQIVLTMFFFFIIIKSDEQVQACIYRMIFRTLSEGLGAVTVGLYGQVCIRQV